MQLWWDILEVEQNADLRTIKRAYAEKLKAIHQDENPVAFIELREAYENARAYEGSTAPASIHEPIFLDQTSYEEDLEPVLSNVEHLLAQVETLMTSTTDRNKVEKWENIFDTLSYFSLDEHTNFELNFIYQMQYTCHRILSAKYTKRRNIRYVPHVMNTPSGRLIFEQFGWDNPQSTIHASAEIRDLRIMLNAQTKESELAHLKKEEDDMLQFDEDQSGEKLWFFLGIVAIISLVVRVIMYAGNSNGSQYY